MLVNPLIDYLLGHRQWIPNGVIIDCLALARLNPSPEQRITTAELMETMEAASQPVLSHRLTRLKDHGLLDYESGRNGAPGYRILRVGPA